LTRLQLIFRPLRRLGLKSTPVASVANRKIVPLFLRAILDNGQNEEVKIGRGVLTDYVKKNDR
jgi:hypothetical protein